MENTNQAAFAKRLSTIERRVRLYHRLAIGLGLMVIASACIAARNVSSKPMTIRATRLDIVNEAGQVVLSVGFDIQGGTLRLWSHDGKLYFGAYATTKGGRLEVLTQGGVCTLFNWSAWRPCASRALGASPSPPRPKQAGDQPT